MGENIKETIIRKDCVARSSLITIAHRCIGYRKVVCMCERGAGDGEGADTNSL
jgi:hypothetical protein